MTKILRIFDKNSERLHRETEEGKRVRETEGKRAGKTEEKRARETEGKRAGKTEEKRARETDGKRTRETEEKRDREEEGKRLWEKEKEIVAEKLVGRLKERRSEEWERQYRALNPEYLYWKTEYPERIEDQITSELEESQGQIKKTGIRKEEIRNREKIRVQTVQKKIEKQEISQKKDIQEQTKRIVPEMLRLKPEFTRWDTQNDEWLPAADQDAAESKGELRQGLKTCLDRINEENLRRYEIWKNKQNLREATNSRYEPNAKKIRTQALKMLYQDKEEENTQVSMEEEEKFMETLWKKISAMRDEVGTEKHDIFKNYAKFQSGQPEDQIKEPEEHLSLVYRQTMQQDKSEVLQKQYQEGVKTTEHNQVNHTIISQEQQFIRQVKELKQEVLQEQTKELERIVEQKVQQKIHQQANELTDKVYIKLERRLKGEKKRRGY